MSNPLFNALGGQGQNGIVQQFQDFMGKMRGQDPRKILDELVSSGQISQQQLNQAQQQAQRMENLFAPLRGRFGK